MKTQSHSPRGSYLIIMLITAFFMNIAASLLLRHFFPETSSVSLVLQQCCASILIFAIPSLFTEYWFRQKHQSSAYSISPSRFTRRRLLLVFGCFVACIPLSNLLGYLNHSLLEQSWFTIGSTLLESERSSQLIMEQMLADRTPWVVALIMIVLGFVVPICEELFMRGGLQGWMYRNTKQIHLSVWVVGIIFSAMHMEWSAFLPRVLMGVILGYIAIYGSLVLAITFHVINNSITYVLYLLTGQLNDSLITSYDEMVIYTVLSFISIGVLFFLLRLMRVERREVA